MTNSVIGSKVEVGQTIKDGGRWYTIARWADEDWARNELRVAMATTTKGDEVRLPVLDDVTYPLRQEGKSGVTPITARDWRGGGHDTTIEVVFRKRLSGGWYVNRADNGRQLGWLCKEDGGWSARITSRAFCGTGPDDTGASLDSVPLHLFRGGNSEFESRSIGIEQDRTYAAHLIVNHLVDQGAPAVGFGAHYAVRRWEDR
jgi:hypothetical protein